MERDDRPTAPAHATGAVEFVSLDDVADDLTFRLREPGDVTALAASIGRLGQVVPVELRPLPGAESPPPGSSVEDVLLAGLERPRWQLVAGFRRLEALRLLQRDRVLARVHRSLSDEDAWALALAKPLLAEPFLASELEVLRGRLAAEGVAGWAGELLDEALGRTPVPPEERERFAEFLRQREQVHGSEAETLEVTPEELAMHLAVRIFELNQELAAGWEAWDELPAEGRRHIVEQARYLAELFPLMEREDG